MRHLGFLTVPFSLLFRLNERLYHIANKNVYFGQWFNNMRHGEGIYVMADKCQYKYGVWDTGILQIYVLRYIDTNYPASLDKSKKELVIPIVRMSFITIEKPNWYVTSVFYYIRRIFRAVFRKQLAGPMSVKKKIGKHYRPLLKYKTHFPYLRYIFTNFKYVYVYYC